MYEMEITRCRVIYINVSYSKVESFLSDKNFIDRFDHVKLADNRAKWIS